jgi:phenylacetate-CoA ligase
LNPVFDSYGTLLAKVLYPTYEAARGRSTMPYLRYLQETQWWSRGQLEDLQHGLLRRLLHHAYFTTSYYRDLLDQAGVNATQFGRADILQRIPLLTRPLLQQSVSTRESHSPPVVLVRKNSSGTTGSPVQVAYNAGSQDWREAMRLRGYGWAGYQVGHRTLHYWGAGGVGPPSLLKRIKLSTDHAMRRDLYVDSNLRTDADMMNAVAKLREFRPRVVVAYSQGVAALARFIVERQLRTWHDTPVVVGAERLWPHDRVVIEQAFGPHVFETYGSREFMLLGAECHEHDGMHQSMETNIVEILVRHPDGSSRPAAVGETGEVVVTDLHNLASPLIRYVSGDRAVQRDNANCRCGRHLKRIGPIEGRVVEMLYDGRGNVTSGILVSVMFVRLTEFTQQFQLIQKVDRSVVLRVVPKQRPFPQQAHAIVHEHLGKYLPGVSVTVEEVDAIPLTKAGKLRIVINEALTPPAPSA